ncbi:MAG: ATP-binding protein [Synechococcaceae cyanobacterium SM2_3_2]|nr:ATP-binding protein [Synechococcaceae cyanobacterium SM2_3_2]
MSPSQITLVTGPPGGGKTTWIRQQLSQSQDSIIYFAAGAGSLPIDGVHLGVEFRHLKVLLEGQEEDLLQHIQTGIPVIVEMAFHIDPVQMQQIFGHFECHWVGITSDPDQDSESYLWADELIPGQALLPPLRDPQIWRAPLTGQVWDPASLELFWDELLMGAYGQIYRVKGIFEMPEGQAIFGEFTKGSQRTYLDDFDVLDMPRHVKGRPQRLTGLEVLGRHLDTRSMSQTVQDSCLSDLVLADYQRQIQEAIDRGELAA